MKEIHQDTNSNHPISGSVLLKSTQEIDNDLLHLNDKNGDNENPNSHLYYLPQRTLSKTSLIHSDDVKCWEKILIVIFKYFYYYIGFIILFLHLPSVADSLFKREERHPVLKYLWLGFHILAFIYCYTLPFAFVFVTFSTMNNDSFAIYVNTVFFVHVNLLILNKIFKEKIQEVDPIFNFKNPTFSWFTWRHTSYDSIKQKMSEIKIDIELFSLSYIKIASTSINLKYLINDDKLKETPDPCDPMPLIYQALKVRYEDIDIYKDVKNIFRLVSIVGVIFRVVFLFIALQTHYEWKLPYQFWLSLGIFGTIYFEFAFTRNLDMVMHIVSLKRLRQLIALESIEENDKTMVNVCCPITIMTWTKIIKILQKAGLDYIKREDLLNSLYIIWYLVLVVIIIADKIYQFDHDILVYDLLWIYSIDILTLCYVIIVRLYYGTKVNAQLCKMQKHLRLIDKYVKDLKGFFHPLLELNPTKIRFGKNKILTNHLLASLRGREITKDLLIERLKIVDKTLVLCIDEFNNINDEDSYKFLGFIPCNKSFFYSAAVSLLTIASTAFFTQGWKQLGNTPTNTTSAI